MTATDIHALGSRRRLRRAILILALAVAFGASFGYWLATTGVTTTSIGPPAGTPATGAAVDVTAIGSAVTRGNGQATLQTGVAIARLAMAKALTTAARIDVFWTNANQSQRVLNNLNVQLSIGLYHPVHTGSCNNTTPGGTVDAPIVTVTDSDSSTYCMVLDQAAIGSATVSATGKLLLSKSVVGGYLLAKSTGGTGSIGACASSGASETGSEAWCRPALISDANQRALYVVASITTPGGIPNGQQPDLNALSFFVKGKKAS